MYYTSQKAIRLWIDTYQIQNRTHYSIIDNEIHNSISETTLCDNACLVAGNLPVKFNNVFVFTCDTLMFGSTRGFPKVCSKLRLINNTSINSQHLDLSATYVDNHVYVKDIKYLKTLVLPKSSIPHIHINRTTSDFFVTIENNYALEEIDFNGIRNSESVVLTMKSNKTLPDFNFLKNKNIFDTLDLSNQCISSFKHIEKVYANTLKIYCLSLNDFSHCENIRCGTLEFRCLDVENMYNIPNLLLADIDDIKITDGFFIDGYDNIKQILKKYMNNIEKAKRKEYIMDMVVELSDFGFGDIV